MKRVGLLTLNKNIDNFFNENEQLAFSVAHVVPGERARASAHPPCDKRLCTYGHAPPACASSTGHCILQSQPSHAWLCACADLQTR